MKKILFSSIIILIFVQFNCLKNNLRSSGEITFSSSNGKNEKPSVMEDIFHSKSVAVTTNTARFKQSTSNNSNPNFETPTIVSRNFQDITSRVAGATGQSISNSAAFDAVYRDHQDYYNNRRFFVFDKNFNKMENYMLDGFRKQLDANINYNPNIQHASSIERNKLNIDFSNTPYV
jgi:hypothetical protein